MIGGSSDDHHGQLMIITRHQVASDGFIQLQISFR